MSASKPLPKMLEPVLRGGVSAEPRDKLAKLPKEPGHYSWPAFIVFFFLTTVAFIAPGRALADIPQRDLSAAGPQSEDLKARLAKIGAAIEEKRKALGVPGAALAIVKDGEVVYASGFGLRDVERRLPATPNTLFGIGSSTKAFTAMAVAIAADDGLLSLDDSPKKFLPNFRLQDPDADRLVTLRDLLSHRTGVQRTDLVFMIGALSRQEIIEGIAMLRPTAKLRERFQYQNLMFVAAGEAAAKAENTTYEALVASRIFTPLRMNGTTFSMKTMSDAPDHAVGYVLTAKGAETIKRLDPTVIAAAGGIHSNVIEMAQWVKLMLAGGKFEGNRIVSEKSFAELVKAHVKAEVNQEYGLGWFLEKWNGHRVVAHGGNLPGFEGLVAFMPEEKIGFVLLTNVYASALRSYAADTIWSTLVTERKPLETAAPAASDPKDVRAAFRAIEAGHYVLPGGDDFVVGLENGALNLSAPNQPKYPLEALEGRRYKLGAPAPAGYFVTFRLGQHMPHTTEMFLDQPNGKFILPMRSEKALAGPSVNWAALADVYRSIGKLGPIEVAYVGGELALIVPGQPAYPLVERTKDSFVLGGLPADKWGLVVLRSTRGTIAGVVLNQPNGSFEFTPTASKKADMTLAELQSRVIAAAGGEDRLRRLTSITAEAEIEFEGQGLTGKARLYNKAPNLFASDLDLFAFGKPVARMHDFLGAEAEGIQTEGEAIKPHAPEKLEQMKIEADLREPLNWQSNYKEVVLKGRSKINSEDCYAVVKRLASGNQLVEYYSATTFLLIRQDFIVKTSSNGEASKTDTTTYSDYRDVDGLMMSFAQKGTADGLAMNVRIASLKVDLPIGAEVFQARPVAGQ